VNYDLLIRGCEVVNLLIRGHQVVNLVALRWSQYLTFKKQNGTFMHWM